MPKRIIHFSQLLLLTAILTLIHSYPAISQEKPQEDRVLRFWMGPDGGGKVGLINDRAELVLPPEYDFIDNFASGGVALVNTESQYGVVNRKGKFVIPLGEYDEIDMSRRGQGRPVRVRKNNQWGIVDQEGKVVISPQYDGLWYFADNGLAFVCKEKQYGYIDQQGKVVIPLQYDDAGYFDRQDLAVVKKGEKYGVINSKGEMITPFQYDEIKSFYEKGLAAAKKGGKWGYINTQGKDIIPFQYDTAMDFHRTDLVKVSEGKEQWLIDQNGTVVTSLLDYEEMRYAPTISHGLAVLRKDGKAGVIDYQGKTVIPFEYDTIWGFSSWSNTSRVRKGDKWGCIDKAGNEVIPIQYDSLGIFGRYDDLLHFVEDDRDLTHARKDGKIGWINRKNEVVIPFQYDKVLLYHHHLAFGETGGLAGVKKDEKWGFIDETGNVVIPFEYDDITAFMPNGLAHVQKNGKWGWINRKNEVVISFQYAEEEVYWFGSDPITVEKEGVSFIVDTNGKVLLTIETLCGVGILRNAEGKMIWSPGNRSEADLCKEKAAKPRTK